MKTIIGYLQSISEEDVRLKAVNNCVNCIRNDRAESLPHALLVAFCWAKSPEGHIYWSNIYDSLKNQQ